MEPPFDFCPDCGSLVAVAHAAGIVLVIVCPRCRQVLHPPEGDDDAE